MGRPSDDTRRTGSTTPPGQAAELLSALAEYRVARRRVAGVDRYALVILENLTVSAVLVFPGDLTRVGALLGKRHSDQATTLQLTRQDFIGLLADRAGAATAGVQIWTPSQLEGETPS